MHLFRTLLKHFKRRNNDHVMNKKHNISLNSLNSVSRRVNFNSCGEGYGKQGLTWQYGTINKLIPLCNCYTIKITHFVQKTFEKSS